MHRDGEEKTIYEVDEVFSRESGRYFIAGTNINIYLQNMLERIVPKGYKLKFKSVDDCKFVKIIWEPAKTKTDPIDNDNNDLFVSGFRQFELENAVRAFQNPDYDSYSYDTFKCVNLFSYMYEKYGIAMFKMLSEYMHFCTVIYDYNNKCLIGGVSVPNSDFNHLFYGYNTNGDDKAFSNHPGLLGRFCTHIIEIPNNTYMINGELHSFGKTEEEKLKELLESEVGRKLIDELFEKKFIENLSKTEGFSRKLK